MTSISVIIPAFDNLPDVLKCLSSLQAFASRTLPIEFIVADDASPNVDYPKLLPPCAAKVIRSSENGGFAMNANTGAAYAEGDILFFVNQDVYAIAEDAYQRPFSANWDVALVEAFANPEVGVVGAKLLFPDGRVQSAGGLYDAHRQPYHPALGYANHIHPECNTPRFVSWVTGAALAIRRDLFQQVGGFDTGYVKGYFEDCDLCEQVKVNGFKVWYEPRVQLVHPAGSTGGNPLFMQNAKRFHDKWVQPAKIEPDTYAIKAGWW